MSDPFEWLGSAGIVLSCFAYLPQIAHLVQKRCAAGVSVRAWTLWLVASLLIGVRAVSKGDGLFIAVQTVNVLAAGTVALLGQRYRHGTCEKHRNWTATRAAGVAAEDRDECISRTGSVSSPDAAADVSGR